MTRFLITSAIPYVNGVKHLGNLVGSLLPADVHVPGKPIFISVSDCRSTTSDVRRHRTITR